MGAGLRADEDARAFLREPAALDAVAVKHRGVGGEAGKERRERAARGPVHHVAQWLEEGLVVQPIRLRLAARDHEAVEAGVLQRVMGAIAGRDVLPDRLAARHIREGEELDLDIRADEAAELDLGLPEGGIRHVVQKADAERLWPGVAHAACRNGTIRHRSVPSRGKSGVEHRDPPCRHSLVVTLPPGGVAAAGCPPLPEAPGRGLR